MANTDKFEMIANMYDTPERIQTAKVPRTYMINDQYIQNNRSSWIWATVLAYYLRKYFEADIWVGKVLIGPSTSSK